MSYTNKLLILPQDQVAYHSLIEETHLQLLISRQALPNIDFCDLLIRTKQRGVDVQLLLSDPRYFDTYSAEEIAREHLISYDMALYSKVTLGEKANYIKYLQNNDISIRFVNHHKVFLNHSKFMIMDKEQLFIGSAPNEHSTRIDMGIVSTNKNFIHLFEQLFLADFHGTRFNPEIANNIAIGPYNIRATVESLLLQAKESIYLMFPVITDDPTILEIIKNKIGQNVKIHILCSPDIFITSEGPNIDIQFNEKLKSYGVHLKELYNPIIHNRCIIIDPENAPPLSAKIFLGSGNLKTSSLDKSRESGIVLEDYQIISKVRQIFQQLWDM